MSANRSTRNSHEVTLGALPRWTYGVTELRIIITADFGFPLITHSDTEAWVSPCRAWT